ncbi:Uncharacterized protein HZ326_19867 [Fusarium oxysporum f. sp. albedinis]|nr:Uncharacterized protein HZ326_19867 [Fusarium oxysporum f. sp. albedinis]
MNHFLSFPSTSIGVSYLAMTPWEAAAIKNGCRISCYDICNQRSKLAIPYPLSMIWTSITNLHPTMRFGSMKAAPRY